MNEAENLDNSAVDEYRYSYLASDAEDSDNCGNDEEVNPYGANLPVMRSMLLSVLPSCSAVLGTQQVAPDDSHTKAQKHRRYGKNLTPEQIERILKNVRVYGMTHAVG